MPGYEGSKAMDDNDKKGPGDHTQWDTTIGPSDRQSRAFNRSAPGLDLPVQNKKMFQSQVHGHGPKSLALDTKSRVPRLKKQPREPKSMSNLSWLSRPEPMTGNDGHTLKARKIGTKSSIALRGPSASVTPPPPHLLSPAPTKRQSDPQLGLSSEDQKKTVTSSDSTTFIGILETSRVPVSKHVVDNAKKMAMGTQTSRLYDSKSPAQSSIEAHDMLKSTANDKEDQRVSNQSQAEDEAVGEATVQESQIGTVEPAKLAKCPLQRAGKPLPAFSEEQIMSIKALIAAQIDTEQQQTSKAMIASFEERLNIFRLSQNSALQENFSRKATGMNHTIHMLVQRIDQHLSAQKLAIVGLEENISRVETQMKHTIRKMTQSIIYAQSVRAHQNAEYVEAKRVSDQALKEEVMTLKETVRRQGGMLNALAARLDESEKTSPNQSHFTGSPQPQILLARKARSMTTLQSHGFPNISQTSSSSRDHYPPNPLVERDEKLLDDTSAGIKRKRTGVGKEEPEQSDIDPALAEFREEEAYRMKKAQAASTLAPLAAQTSVLLSSSPVALLSMGTVDDVRYEEAYRLRKAQAASSAIPVIEQRISDYKPTSTISPSTLSSRFASRDVRQSTIYDPPHSNSTRLVSTQASQPRISDSTETLSVCDSTVQALRQRKIKEQAAHSSDSTTMHIEVVGLKEKVATLIKDTLKAQTRETLTDNTHFERIEKALYALGTRLFSCEGTLKALQIKTKGHSQKTTSTALREMERRLHETETRVRENISQITQRVRNLEAGVIANEIGDDARREESRTKCQAMSDQTNTLNWMNRIGSEESVDQMEELQVAMGVIENIAVDIENETLALDHIGTHQ